MYISRTGGLSHRFAASWSKSHAITCAANNIYVVCGIVTKKAPHCG